MAQPFIISYKIVGDATSGIQAVNDEKRALESLQQTLTHVSGAGGTRQRIDSMLGIGGAGRGPAEAAADIEAYGRELDALRAKFNPLFAAEQRQQQAITEINRAHRLGAISADEASAAILREKQVYDSLTASLANNTGARNTNHAATFNTANVAAQFQDIGVTAAMGMSPLQIALQQGTQLSAVLGTTGAAGAATLLKTALFSILSPVSLLTIGIVGIAAAALQWVGSMMHGTESVTDALKRHADELKDIVQGYSDAERAVTDYAEAAQRQSSGVIGVQLGAQLAQAKKEADAFRIKVEQFYGILSGPLQSDANKNLASLIDEFRSGAIGAEDLALEAAKIGVDPAVADITKAIAKSLADGAVAASRINDLLISIDHALAATSGNGGLQIALDSMIEAKRSAEAHQIDLDAINAKSPAQLADIARRREALALANEEISVSLRQQQIEEAGALALAQAQYALSEADRQRLFGMNNTLAGAQLELTTIGKSISETTRLTFVREQLASAEAEAAQHGVAVSAAYVAAVEKIGAAYGDLRQRIEESRVVADLSFERSLFGMSDSERDVATRLREIYGGDVQAHMDGFIASQIRINETLKTFDDTGKDILTGMIHEISDAFSDLNLTAEETGNILAGVFDKIANKAEEQLASGLWDLIFGAITGGIGSLGGGGLTGGVMGRGLWGSAIFGQNAKGTDFWRGGLTSVNEEGGEIIDLPRGSRVIPHDVSMEMARTGSQSAPVIIHYHAPAISGVMMDRRQVSQLMSQREDQFAAAIPDVLADHRRRGALG